MSELNKNEIPLEELFQGLEQLIAQMEDKEITLEKAFSLYETGIQQLKQCNEKIDRVEKKFKILNGDGELMDEEV